MSNKTEKMSDKEIIKKFNSFQEALKNPKTTMTPEKLDKLKKRVLESMSIDRQRLVTRQPFIGGILMRFELVPVRTWRLDTASTDGKRIFFDIDFYKKLSEKERLFVFAHECWHCVYLHFLRKHNRNKGLWNIATDCEINYMLKNENFNPPPNLCFPDKEDEGKCAEEIYESLVKKMKKQKKDNSGQNCQCGSSCSDGNSKSGKNKDDNSGKMSGQFDKHVSNGDENGDGNGNGNGNEDNENGVLPKDSWGEKGEDEDYRPMVDQDAAERMREAVISEAQKIERKQGTLPGGLSSFLEKLRKSEIPWKDLLATEITKIFTDKKTWIPPSRRHVHEDMYFQSRRGEMVKVKVVVDTSGSTTADLPKFMSETVSLLNSFSNYEMEFIQCDAKVHSAVTYDDYNQFPVDDCKQIEFKGFSGSDFTPAFEYIEKNSEEPPNTVIFFTDGYITVPQNPPPYNVVWVLTNDGNKDLCNYGKKIIFRDKVSEY